MTASVLLIDPKYDFNVGGVVRAAALFGASEVRWSGTRVPTGKPGHRGIWLPREERAPRYSGVECGTVTDAREFIEKAKAIPVAVERRRGAEDLPSFIHPKDALYVFGPEDGSLGRAILSLCHRFVAIPSLIESPLTLAAAANVVLYDRMVNLGGAR